jgi:hypothetical protein
MNITINIKCYHLSNLILIEDYLFWLIWDAPIEVLFLESLSVKTPLIWAIGKK